ncbi:MAG: TRAP transporter large permease subunit [Acidobacteriota bacterium]
MKKSHVVENTVSVAALLLMAVLPLAEIAIREFDPSGIPGSATWVQHLALWVGFLGAAIAARRGELLSLTAGATLLKGTMRAAAEVFTAGVAFAVCAVLASGSLELLRIEREGGRELALGVPAWVGQLVMPLGFALIGLRILSKVPFWTGRAAAGAFIVFPLLLGSLEDLPGTGVVLPLLVIVLGATALGAPIFAGLAGVAAVLLWNNFDPVSAIPLETYSFIVLKPILPTIPLFTLAGYILAEGGTPRRLVELFRALVGWMPGGVAVVAIVVSAFFTSFTGGSGVTILAMGGLLYPMLLEEKHPHRFSTGLLTSAGSLGLLFPPSLAVIVYGLVAGTDVRRLFVSGWTPAVLEIGLVVGFALFHSRRSGITRVPLEANRVVSALWEAKWEVAIPFVVLGSILGGFATLVEASAVTVLYAFVLEFFVHKDLSLRRDLPRVVGDAATLIGGVLLILGVAPGLTNYLVIAEIPYLAVQWVQSFVQSPLFFLLLLNLFLLVVGCVMDIWSAIVVVVPLIVPLGQLFGIDPFHLGIIFLTNLELGYLTPPVGLNLFLASHRFKRPLPEVYRAALPFLAIRAVAVLLVTYVPALTRFLPNLLLGK